MINTFQTVPHGLPMPLCTDLIWRYMSFERFKDLLEKSTLYFSRIDKFSDFQEASMSEATRKKGRADLANQGDDGSMANLVECFSENSTTSTCYANCWTINPIESNLHWRAYGNGGSFKIAVVSTVAGLLESIENLNLNKYAGLVNYIDYQKDDSPKNVIQKAFVKRNEYNSENEFRVLEFKGTNCPSGLFNNQKIIEEGISVPVNLEKLISKIMIEPLSIDGQKLGRSFMSKPNKVDKTKFCNDMVYRKKLVSDLCKKHISQEFNSIEFSGIL